MSIRDDQNQGDKAGSDHKTRSASDLEKRYSTELIGILDDSEQDDKPPTDGEPLCDDGNGGNGDPKPEGKLSKPSANFLKKQGVDPHILKDRLGGRVAAYDIYMDRQGNLFAIAKGASESTAMYLGDIDEFR